MKKSVKIISTLLMVMMVLIGLSTMVSAASVVNKLNGNTVTNTNFIGVANNILGILTTVGAIIAVIILAVLGIKYMMGSASEKAEYKKTFIPYIIGALLVFGAPAIGKAIVALVSNVTTTSGV